MGEDIVPGLLSDITEEFRRLYEESGEIQGLLHKVRSGTATYEEARDYAKAVSRVTGEAWQKCVTAETLPDGRMYFNIASRLVPAKLDENYSLVSEYARKAQEALNRKAGIGLKAQTPKENQDRVNGLVELAAEAEEYAEVEGRLLAGMENFSLNIVDEAVRLNADFQYSAGMRPQVVRRVNRPCCAWCAALEGVYDYAEVKQAGSDVWRRHLNCDCLIEYVPATGRRETVSNYRLPNDQQPGIMEARKNNSGRKEHRTLLNSELENGLPISSSKNSISDKVDDSGNVLQRRIYGADGRAMIDFDTSDHGDPRGHPTGAHKHVFDYSKKNPHGPPLPLTEEDLTENSDIIQRGGNYFDEK